MIRRFFVGSVILVCCGCSTASTHTEVASAKWRMENLEQRFLDFKEKAALREAGLSSRITKLEKQLGLPVPKRDEMLASSSQLTPDVHVFVSPTSSNDAQKDATVKNDTLMSENMKVSDEKNTEKKEVTGTKQESAAAESVSFESQKNAAKANATAGTLASDAHPVTSPFTATKSGTSVSPQPSEKSSTYGVGNSSASSNVQSAAKPVAKAVNTTVGKPASAPQVVSQPTSATQKSTSSAVKKTGSVSMYKHGLKLLEQGRHAEGRERLEEFLTEFPHDRLVPNAVYWIGESFYSEKDYLVAIDLFREVLRRYPDSSKATAAMLKIGYSYERVGEMSEARRQLLKVVEKYPKSNEARLARKKLSGS